MRRFTILLMMLTLVCLPAGGCVSLGPKADPSRFYTLTSLAEAGMAPGKEWPHPASFSLGIGPIEFPAYLDREQLVTRISQNRFAIAETDRWVEPLAENFARVLSQNLSALLGADKVIRYPWQNNQRPAYQVRVEVLRFEPNAALNAQLMARWVVVDAGANRALSAKESRLKRAIKGNSTEESVAALSEILADFSREIAAVLRVVVARAK